ALEKLADEGHALAQFEALSTRAHVSGWLGESEEDLRYMEQALMVATVAGRKDLETLAAQGLAMSYLTRLELDRAEQLVRRALSLSEESGSIRARAFLGEVERRLAQRVVGTGRVEEAERLALSALETVGPEDATSLITTTMALGVVRAAQGRDEEAEQLMRQAVEAASSFKLFAI